MGRTEILGGIYLIGCIRLGGFIMKRLVFLLFCILGALVTNAQSYHGILGIQSDSLRRVHYKKVVNEIFKEDELFVLFYLNLALVVDPTQESQIVETITTENPWESLTKYLNGKSNIYFCPSGDQLNVAIEYMSCPLDKDILMSDRYGMYRLSSPEELFKNRGESFRQSKHKAVVFGGLKYDEMSEPQKDNLLAFRGKREAVNGYEYLRSTYEEAIYIDSIFRKNGIETALLTGENGTEESFTQIPSSHADILHIASHGEYNPDKDNLESSSLQEWMMSHSWLALSGADNDATGGSDGRLTAYEISQTDLSSINLVVLSACDTGLGDVKENDVYGLLKGFKKAGAGTLLLSLSEVSDTVTGLLMKRFYDNLFRGDNPRRALENAQRYIRLHGNGQFNKPEYWASFILVDDLDRNVGKDVSDSTKKEFLITIVEANKFYSEDNLFPNWNEIRKKMGTDDAIIRIWPYVSKNIVDYVALIGDANSGRCNVVRLFSIVDNKIEKYQIKDDDGKISLYDIPFPFLDSLVWKPMLPHITKMNNLYIQSAGVFNSIPFECLPSVTDIYNIHRISSLNILYEEGGGKVIKDKQSIALFGGLCYDSDSYIPVYDYPALPLERGAVYDIPYLYGTKIETDKIAKLLSNKGCDVLLFQEDKGTESLLYTLSGRHDLQMLHFATHAFWWNRVRNSNSISGCLLNKNGLFLSGAKLVWYNNRIRPNNADGILLGEEISKLDFSDLSL